MLNPSKLLAVIWCLIACVAVADETWPCVPQVAVSRLVLNTDYVELPQGHRMGHASNVSFDAATFEIWGALLNGGTLVGVDKNVALDPVAFAQSIQTQRISILFVTTALFNALSKQQPDVFAQLDYCLFGGEACDRA